MKNNELREIQSCLKKRYRSFPDESQITLSSKGCVVEGGRCTVKTNGGLITTGLHPAAGGRGDVDCAANMLLSALVACTGTTLSAVATTMGIDYRRAEIRADGGIDFRGALGVSNDVPISFSGITLHISLDTNASKKQVATLLRLTKKYCVVYQTIANPPNLSIECHSPT